MAQRVFIRHADKGTTTPDDPLLPGQEGKIQRRSQMLVSKYGSPDIILVSPFLRTRQTAELLASGLDNSIDIVVEPLLSEYIKHDQGDVQLREDTLMYGPIVYDTRDSIRNRIREVYNKYCHLESNMWFVCHGIFLHDLLDWLGKTPRRVPTLAALVISREQITLQLGNRAIEY